MVPHALTPRAATAAALARARIVAVIRERDAERAAQLAARVLGFGLPALEITRSTPGCFDTLRALAERFPAACLGAGTIMSAADVHLARSAGARFIVAPNTDPQVIHAAAAAELVAIPGALTPTEVVQAHQAGADFVKIFPISAVGGAAYLRLLRGPLPDIPLWVSGSVGLEDIEPMLAAGAALVGLTSALTAELPAAEPAQAQELERRVGRALRARSA